MTHDNRNKKQIFETLPPEWDQALLPEIQDEIKRLNRKIVILDDDPTGTQTVHDLPVLTTWSVQTLKQELLNPGPGFFILTNSRSLDRQKACVLGLEIGKNLQKASELAGIKPIVISRSDSTLRGHFPHEVDEVARAMGDEDLPYLIFPFFPEGGRFTIDDIHYVAEGDDLVPAGQTPYAKDAAFGFTRSNLKEWVAEKTEGRIRADTVTSISLSDIRRGGPERVCDLLSGVKKGTACIVNAVSYGDVEVFVTGLIKAGEKGKQFLYRTAAAFVRVMAGVTPKGEFLSREELVSDSPSGGLFVVGSYVPKTTTQLAVLKEETKIVPIEIDVEKLLAQGGAALEIDRVTDLVNGGLEQGKDVVIFTSRALVAGSDAKTSLNIGQVVSDSLIRIVRGLAHQPRYLLAKGGITSSDVATKGLGVKRAMVTGQVLPGVPVWKLGTDSRYPGMSYIIFPGNVGDDNALAAIQKKLVQGG